MKKIILSLFAFGVFALINSCTSDPCKDKTATTLCNGKGTLVSNTSTCDCACNTGYTGTSCNLMVAGQYTASNDVLGTSTAVSTYTSVASLSGTTVTFTSFKNAFFKNVVVGTISGNTITLNANQQPDNDGYSISGTGTISSTGTTVSIKWAYSITGKNSAGTTVTDNINGTWTK